MDGVFVLLVDKGRMTVVIEREQYDTKMHQLFADERTCRQVKKDPSIVLERK